jgi:hypothetical protein
MAAPALSSQNLRHPQWRGEYHAALLGLDRQTLLERVAAAETVILARLPASATGPEGRRERQIIEDSLRFLRVLQKRPSLRSAPCTSERLRNASPYSNGK